MRTRWLFLAPCLVACSGPDDRQGTVVGNPGSMAARVAPAEDLVFDHTLVPFARIVHKDCDGTTEEVLGQPGALDLEGRSAIQLIEGSWCTLNFAVGGAIELDGSGPEGPDPGTFSLTLEHPGSDLLFSGADPIEVGPDPFVLELGAPGWIAAADIGLSPGGAVSVDPSSPEHDDLLYTGLLDQASLWVDADADGEVDPDERAGAPVATWTP